MNPAVLIRATLLMLAISQFALADDVKTINGKEYKNVTVSRAEPDGIVVKTKSGISKIYFTELSRDDQLRFGYDAAKIEAEKAKRIEEEQAVERERAEQNRSAEADLKSKAAPAADVTQLSDASKSDIQDILIAGDRLLSLAGDIV